MIPNLKNMFAKHEKPVNILNNLNDWNVAEAVGDTVYLKDKMMRSDKNEVDTNMIFPLGFNSFDFHTFKTLHNFNNKIMNNQIEHNLSVLSTYIRRLYLYENTDDTAKIIQKVGELELPIKNLERLSKIPSRIETYEIIQYILSHYHQTFANESIYADNNGVTSSQYATYGLELELLSSMFEQYNFRFNTSDKFGNCHLHFIAMNKKYAVKHKDLTTNIMVFLLEKGLNPFKTNHNYISFYDILLYDSDFYFLITRFEKFIQKHEELKQQKTSYSHFAKSKINTNEIENYYISSIN